MRQRRPVIRPLHPTKWTHTLVFLICRQIHLQAIVAGGVATARRQHRPHYQVQLLGRGVVKLAHELGLDDRRVNLDRFEENFGLGAFLAAHHTVGVVRFVWVLGCGLNVVEFLFLPLRLQLSLLSLSLHLLRIVSEFDNVLVDA